MSKPLLCLLLTAVAFLLSACERSAPEMSHGLPWQVDSQNNQLRVFDITLGQSTLNDAIAHFGDNHELAFMLNSEHNSSQDGNLELYFPSLHFGPLSGKLIFVAALTDDDKKELLDNMGKVTRLETGVKKISLNPKQTSQALNHAIKAITFLPTARLDEALILKHFGASAQVLELSETVKAYIYPQLSLHIVINSKGKDFIEYRLPEDFEQLRMQLFKQSSPQTLK